MCGRLNQNPEHVHSWREYRGFLELEIPRINVAPTESLALIREGRIDLARWWLTPSWSDGPSQKYSMFNARSEKLTQSPALRGPFKSQRGIVPMSSFIEWRTSDGKKQPWSIHRDGENLYAAALWDEWRGESETLLSCTIVTTAAAKAFEPWHHRMPVLLEGEEVERWLDSSATIAANDPMFAPRLKFAWKVNPLPTAVGNARNKSAELMEPVGDAVELDAEADPAA